MSGEPASWRRMRALFEEVVDLDPEAQGARLRRPDVDPLLREAVERLLAADSVRDDFFAQHTPSPRDPPAPASRPATASLPQTQLGRYRLLAPLGAGGMGEVYLAHDPALDRRVALKLLSPRLTGDPHWLRRFVREARAASALNHPNVLTIHEVGEVDGVHFIASEFVEGETLRRRLEHGALTTDDAVEIAAQIASGLGEAHTHGIVHRDVKPENVMLRKDGYVKVLDFGLAKVVGLVPDASGRRPTVPGMLIGTMSYMSPEQARGLEVDARSDLFSLGIVLYEMLTGRLPFAGQTPIDVLVALLDREPAPAAQLVPGLDDELARILERTLAKEPAARPQSARELHDELRRLQRRRATPAAGTPASSHGPAPDVPPVHYARSGDVNIAYQVLGDAPLDLVFVMGWISHLEYFWSEPSFARFLRRLARFSRVILFDKRGTGLSDRVPPHQLPTLEQRMDDVRAVMEAVGSERAVLCGVSEGGPMCSLFAATYPERTIALVMIGSYARRLQGDGYPWGPTLAEREQFFAEIRDHWGGPVGLAERAPSKAADAHFREWWAAYLRHGASPNAALALTRMNTEIDIRKVLPSVQVPTLVVHRTDDACLKVEEGRFLAAHIPGARFVELPGVDHLPFVGDQDAILDQIEEFLTGMRPAPEFDRVLATVIVARVLGYDLRLTEEQQAETFARYRAFVHRESGAFHDRTVDLSPQRLLAAFDGPARAIRAACSLSDAARKLGLCVQIGLHTGECDASGGRVRGVAVDVATQMAARSRPGEVVVSSTVRDLVAGAGIRFADRGTRVLTGPLGELRVFAVERGAAT